MDIRHGLAGLFGPNLAPRFLGFEIPDRDRAVARRGRDNMRHLAVPGDGGNAGRHAVASSIAAVGSTVGWTPVWFRGNEWFLTWISEVENGHLAIGSSGTEHVKIHGAVAQGSDGAGSFSQCDRVDECCVVVVSVIAFSGVVLIMSLEGSQKCSFPSCMSFVVAGRLRKSR
jgi:hypothetical protein